MRKTLVNRGIAVLFLLAPLFLFSQTITRKGYDQLKDTKGNTISQHTRIEKGFESAFKNPLDTLMYYPAPIQIITKREIQTDTVYVNSNWENVKLIDTIAVNVFKWGITPKEGVYLKDRNSIDLYQIPMDSTQRDSLPYRNFTAHFEQTKDWPTATSTYRLIDTDNILDIKKQTEVIDGVLGMDADDYCQGWWDIFDAEFPQMIKHSDVELSYNWDKHRMKLTDWDPGSKYKIVGYMVDKNLDTVVTDTLRYSHPETTLEALTAQGFKYYTVWVSTITSTSARVHSWTTEQCNVQITIGTSKFNMVEYPTDTGLNASHPGYWQHGRTIEGLLPDTRYYFELTNTNAQGVLIRSSIHSFKTLP